MQPRWMKEIIKLTKDSEIDDVFPCLYYDLQQEIQPDKEKWEAYRAYKNFVSFKDLQYRQVVDETDIEVLKNWLRQRLILRFKIYQGQEVPKHLEENIYKTLKLAYRQSKAEPLPLPFAPASQKKEEENNTEIDKEFEPCLSNDLPKVTGLRKKVFSRIKELISHLGGTDKSQPNVRPNNQSNHHYTTLNKPKPSTSEMEPTIEDRPKSHSPKTTFHLDYVMDLDTIFMTFIKEVMVENKLMLKANQASFEGVYLDEFGLQRPTDIYQDIYLLHHISNWRNEALGQNRLAWDNICYLAYLNNTLGNYVIVPDKKAYTKDLNHRDLNFLETKHIGNQNQHRSMHPKPEHFSTDHWEKDMNTLVTNLILRNYHLLLSLNLELKDNKDIKKYYEEEMTRRKKLSFTNDIAMPDLFA